MPSNYSLRGTTLTRSPLLNTAQHSRFSRVPSWSLWLAGAVAVIVVILSLGDLGRGPGNALPALQKPGSDGDEAFRPSDSQWASLKLVMVHQVAFWDKLATDGKIAINQGTRRRLPRHLGPGDRQGRRPRRAARPMFAIEGSEFVQGHNDLVVALATVESTRSRLELAQSAERRQRELMAIRGGARKDLEQAQAALVAAEGDHHAAQIALGRGA